MKVYQYAKCSTCRKAIQFLEAKGLDYSSVDITETAPTKKQLELAFTKYQDIRKLFNTSGVMYREMGLKDKIKEMSKKESFDLLSKNGKLVKRPFLVDGDNVIVGFKEDEYKKL